jgi:hypothetical protein
MSETERLPLEARASQPSRRLDGQVLARIMAITLEENKRSDIIRRIYNLEELARNMEKVGLTEVMQERN